MYLGPPLPPSLMALRADAEKEENLGMVLANAVTDCMDSLRHYRYLATTEELEINEGTSSKEAETYESTMKNFQVNLTKFSTLIFVFLRRLISVKIWLMIICLIMIRKESKLLLKIDLFV